MRDKDGKPFFERGCLKVRLPPEGIDPRYFRRAEVETLLVDSTQSRQKLGWGPEITAREMCAEIQGSLRTR